MKKLTVLLALLTTAITLLGLPAFACEDEGGVNEGNNGNHHGWYWSNGHHYGHIRPVPWPPGDGCDPKPGFGHLWIKRGTAPETIILVIKAKDCVWYEVQATEDFKTWVTVLIAFGTNHKREFVYPTTPIYSPFVPDGVLGASGHLFFRLQLHNADDPVPPL